MGRPKAIADAAVMKLAAKAFLLSAYDRVEGLDMIGHSRFTARVGHRAGKLTRIGCVFANGMWRVVDHSIAARPLDEDDRRGAERERIDRESLAEEELELARMLLAADIRP